jgi:hypothetical protein
MLPRVADIPMILNDAAGTVGDESDSALLFSLILVRVVLML